MRIGFTIAIASGLVAAASIATPAAAQDRGYGHHRVDNGGYHHVGNRDGHRWNRGYHRGWNGNYWDRGHRHHRDHGRGHYRGYYGRHG